VRKTLLTTKTCLLLVDAVRCCSLGQITGTLFEVGGQYRRNTGATLRARQLEFYGNKRLGGNPMTLFRRSMN